MRATPARAGADPTPLPESLARVSSWLGDGAMQADEPLVVLARARLASTQKKKSLPSEDSQARRSAPSGRLGNCAVSC